MNLEQYLKIGNTVEVQILKEQGKYIRLNTLVEKSYENGLITLSSPMEKGRYIYIPVNTVVMIQFMAEVELQTKELFAFKGKIITSNDSNNGTRVPTIVLEKVSEVTKQQRRESYRLPIVTDIHYKKMIPIKDNPKEFNYGPEKEMLTKNVSVTGLRAVTMEKIPSGTLLSIEIPAENELILIRGSVIDSFPMEDSTLRFDTRVVFTLQTQMQEAQLGRFIMEKQAESIRKSVSGDHILQGFTSRAPEHPEDANSRRCDLIIMLAHMLSIVQLTFFVSIFPRGSLALERLFHYYVPQVYDYNSALYLAIVAVGQLTLLGFGFFFDSFRIRKYGGRYRTGLIAQTSFTLFLLAVSQYLISLNG